MKRVELLSPAKDLGIGIAAINNGADAVYIGAPAFGARKAASNSLEDIARLVEYAHRYYCRVFVTLNTVLYDSELEAAEKMIHELYRIGVDALIVQDMGILRMDLPPICLHASTQMHNYDIERIKFIDKMGFRRIVLARELSLEQIREVRRSVKAELEVFIHGALCVSLSGQCYLSQYMFGRSANRGECAQPCRMKWSVRDNSGKRLVDNRYILSLKDLNLSSYIKDLVDIGVDSFKIEGRLKDENYVSNVTNHYSSLLNSIPNIRRTGSGKVISGFHAEPERSFNRGYSSYFMVKRESGLVNADTPKSMGKQIGKVLQVKGNRMQVQAIEAINNGDGLCYLQNGELKGIRVNTVDGSWLTCNERAEVKPGATLFRNYDHRFVTQLEKAKSVRKIRIHMEVRVQQARLYLSVCDEDGITADLISEDVFETASNPRQKERLLQQLMKCGDTEYVCESVDYLSEEILFVPAAAANLLRRALLDRLTAIRAESREVMLPGKEDTEVAYPLLADWHLNVVNQKAAEFYHDHQVETVATGFEKSKTGSGRDLMHTRYCILHELGRCRKKNKNADLEFPLWLYNDKHCFRLDFDCKECFMRILEKE